MIQLTILGSGTSTGVPTVGCDCEVCQSTSLRDKRLRCSSLMNVDGKIFLIDCGPDFRQQALREHLKYIDALILTHSHFDHIAGIDDLRFFPKFKLYARKPVRNALHHNYSYIFEKTNYVGAIPKIEEVQVDDYETFCLPGDIKAIPIIANHISMDVMGFRIRNFAYLTDFKIISDEGKEKLKNLDCLVLGVLRKDEMHRSHLSLPEALTLLEEIKPKTSFFVHMSHGIGFHADAEKYLTKTLGYVNYHFAYDGMKIQINDDGRVVVLK